MSDDEGVSFGRALVVSFAFAAAMGVLVFVAFFLSSVLVWIIEGIQ